MGRTETKQLVSDEIARIDSEYDALSARLFCRVTGNTLVQWPDVDEVDAMANGYAEDPEGYGIEVRSNDEVVAVI